MKIALIGAAASIALVSATAIGIAQVPGGSEPPGKMQGPGAQGPGSQGSGVQGPGSQGPSMKQPSGKTEGGASSLRFDPRHSFVPAGLVEVGDNDQSALACEPAGRGAAGATAS